MKTAIVATLVLIIAALGAAGVRMLRRRDGDDPRRMARALTVRVGLSIALFLFILLAWQLGWIQPSGLPTGR
jgi:hypothetical protein